MKNSKGLSPLKFWILVWGLGIIGQLCWNMENQWFNTFVYAKIAKDPTIISWMVAVSAIATTVSTFVFGTLSDRVGKRRPFIVGGYILWGVFTILFGMTEFITGGKVSETGVAVMAAATSVVLMDALMSFFGSMGNDASFNAWTNDMMTDRNRGQIGAALATQPVIGTIVGTVTGGMLIGSNDNYMRLFVVMGGLVIAFGLLSLLILRDAEDLMAHKEGSFLHQLLSAFNFKEFFRHRELVWVLIALAVYFISFDVYYPHLGNFLIYYLGFDAGSIGLIEGYVGVFLDAVLDQTGDHVDLRVQSVQFLLQAIGGQMGLQYFVVDSDNPILGVDHLVCGPEEDVLQLILGERRCGAFLTLELVIALPYDPAILVVGVPDLRPVPTAAAAALHPAGEDADRAAPVLSRLPGGHKDLDCLEGIRRDDGFVVVPDVVLRDFTLVVLFLLCQEVHGIGLLEQGIALVFLVRQDAANVAGVPVILPSR